MIAEPLDTMIDEPLSTVDEFVPPLAIASVPLEMFEAFSAVSAAPEPLNAVVVNVPASVSVATFVNPAPVLPLSNSNELVVLVPLTGTFVMRHVSVESEAVDV